MPLPAPATGHPPTQRRLSKAQYKSISDDTTIQNGIRTAVLRALENSTDPEKTFDFFCDGEQLDGPPALFSNRDEIGRAMPRSNFDRHLRSGWFGSRQLGAAASRDLMSDLENTKNSPKDAGDIFRNTLRMAAASIEAPSTVVSWYYHDPDNPLDACECATSDIAHRLALPAIYGQIISPDEARPFYVLVALAKHLDNPMRPRFTDTGKLDFLEVWRPGGRTVPWVSNCKGLEESVASPLKFADHAVAVAFVQCHNP